MIIKDMIIHWNNVFSISVNGHILQASDMYFVLVLFLNDIISVSNSKVDVKFSAQDIIGHGIFAF